jgi:hypothetical protein
MRSTALDRVNGPKTSETEMFVFKVFREMFPKFVLSADRLKEEKPAVFNLMNEIDHLAKKHIYLDEVGPREKHR